MDVDVLGACRGERAGCRGLRCPSHPVRHAGYGVLLGWSTTGRRIEEGGDRGREREREKRREGEGNRGRERTERERERDRERGREREKERERERAREVGREREREKRREGERNRGRERTEREREKGKGADSISLSICPYASFHSLYPT